MGKKNATAAREKKRFNAAIIAREHKTPVREAAAIARLAPTTFARRLKQLTNPPPKKLHHRRALTEEEEAMICDVVLRQADMAKPYTRIDLIDAIAEYCATLPTERQSNLPFKDFEPGPDFMRGFLLRNSNRLRFGRPAKEAEQRWRACNADVLTNHYTSYEHIVKTNNIDKARIFNLDETGVTPNKDTSGRSPSKRLLRTGKASTSQIREVTFSYTHRITMLACVCADGTWTDPLFVIKGEDVEYRLIDDCNNRWKIETIHDCLPPGARYTTRKDTATVDRKNFIAWAREFVEAVKDKTVGGRKVLLTYDGHRSHLSAAVLGILRKGGVLAYCLPAHTSGKTQPLDVGLYGPFKNYLNREVKRAAQIYETDTFEFFDLLHMITRAFSSAFVPHNIENAFKSPGLFPVDPSKLLGTPRPKNAAEADIMMSPDQLMTLLEAKRTRLKAGDCLQPVVLKRGHINSENGILVSADESYKLVKEAEEEAQRKKEQEEAEEQLRLEKVESVRVFRRTERHRFEKWALRNRVKRYGVPNVLPRALKVRAAAAKERIKVKLARLGNQAEA